MSLLLALTGSTSPDANGNLAFTTSGVSFTGTGSETITGTLAATAASITFAGTGIETETGALACITGGISFAGVAAESENGTLAFTAGSIAFAGAGSVVTSGDANGGLAFTTDSIGFAGSGQIIDTQPIYLSTPGFKLTPKFKGETEEEKHLRRETQGIVARAELAKQPSDQLVTDAKDVIEQIKEELELLRLKERQFTAESRYAEMIRVQLAQEQLQAQIEEIDTAFIMMMLIAESV